MAELAITAVDLETDEVDLPLNGKSQRLPCAIVLETDPRPRLSFNITSPNAWIPSSLEKKFPIHVVNADVTCEVFFTHYRNGIVGLAPARVPIAVGQSEDLREVHFDLINFPSFWALASLSTRLPNDQLDIAAEGWHIEIRPPRKSPDLEAFRSTLYSVTHSCVMRKSDNATFSSQEAEDLLNALHDAMSFAAGRWVAPVFVRGFGTDQQIAWKEWGTRPLHPNLGRVETWFDAHHANTLAEILPGVLELRRDAGRAETFHSALYWYMRSTGLAAGVDGGIVLLQAALELLSWQSSVRARKGLSHNKFNELSAEDKLRFLIESCGIPTGIPPGLSDLVSKAKELNCSDGPKALTVVRNRLVHPKKRKHLPHYDAWRLAEWYVELALLSMLRFSGEYSDRTKAQRWIGAVDRVPWAKP